MADSRIGLARIYAARFDKRADAEAMRTKLESFGYDPAEISYISDADKCSFTLDDAGSHVTKAGAEGALGAALVGGGVGATIGALGFGSLVLLGPIGAVVGLGVGGIVGVLHGFGVDSDSAAACARAINAGSLVMTVQAHSGDDARIVAALGDRVIGTEDDVYS